MNINAALGFTTQAGFPAGSVVAGILVTLTAATAANSPAPQTVPPGTANVSFSVANPDTYTGSAIAVDANGNTFGTAVSSDPLVVTAPATVSLTVPDSLALTQTS